MPRSCAADPRVALHPESISYPVFSNIATLPAAQGDASLTRERPQAAVALAWALRQAAPERAAGLLDGVDLTQLPLASAARAELLRAEWRYAHGDLAAAQTQLAALAQGDGWSDEALLQSDRCAVAYLVARAQGRMDDARAFLNSAQAWAEQSGDPSRIGLCQGHQAFEAIVANVDTAEAIWRDPLTRMVEAAGSPAAPYARYLLGMLEYHLGRPGDAALAFVEAVEGLVGFGMAVLASVCANNASAAFDDLQDMDAALDWAQRALDIARSIGLPLPLGLAQRRVAERLRLLGRHEEAAACLEDARRLMHPFRGSRNFILLLLEWGELTLAASDLPEASEHFGEARDRAAEMDAPDLLASAWQGLATVALKAGEVAHAEAAAQQVLEIAQQLRRPVREAEARMTLGRCKALRGERGAALECMRQAIAVEGAETKAPASWWGELEQILAADGDFAAAYAARVKADAAQRVERGQQAQARALAFQVRLQTARLQTEAAAERQRADVLEASTKTLMQLGEVGQELTSLLDEEEVYEAIRRHVEGLLQAEHFAIYLVDASQQVLEQAIAAQGDRRFAPDSVPIDHPSASSARAFRENRELVLELDPEDPKVLWIEGAVRSRSAMFAPLRSGERRLGVLSIQTARAKAFGDREVQVFRSLCAYASIAIANAKAYRALSETQRQLARQQRLAAVGAMVAGVAHEINTPIGNALLSASSLVETGRRIELSLGEGAVSRSRLLQHAREVQEAGHLVVRSLQRADQLVQAFKQLVQDPRTWRRSNLGLRQEAMQALSLHRVRAIEAGHELSIDIPEDLQIEAYREPLGDLLHHWADNALQHGLRGNRGGRLCVSARAKPAGRIEMQLHDDGAGMPPEVLERAFDPFFSTRLGGQHSGLGLAVVHGIAVDLFGGELQLESPAGGGTRLRWTFPSVAPRLTP